MEQRGRFVNKANSLAHVNSTTVCREKLVLIVNIARREAK